MSEVNSLYRSLLTKNNLIWKDNFLNNFPEEACLVDHGKEQNWRRLCIEKYWHYYKGMGIQLPRKWSAPVVGVRRDIWIPVLSCKGNLEVVDFLSQIKIQGLPDSTQVMFKSIELPNHGVVKELETAFGVILVVDSTKGNLLLSEEHRALENYLFLSTIDLLIFAHKQEERSAKCVREVGEDLKILSKTNRSWFIQPTTVCTERGKACIEEGLHWLLRTQLTFNPTKIPSSVVFTSTL